MGQPGDLRTEPHDRLGLLRFLYSLAPALLNRLDEGARMLGAKVLPVRADVDERPCAAPRSLRLLHHASLTPSGSSVRVYAFVAFGDTRATAIVLRSRTIPRNTFVPWG